jgi:hypothetical protein
MRALQFVIFLQSISRRVYRFQKTRDSNGSTTWQPSMCRSRSMSGSHRQPICNRARTFARAHKHTLFVDLDHSLVYIESMLLECVAALYSCARADESLSAQADQNVCGAGYTDKAGGDRMITNELFPGHSKPHTCTNKARTSASGRQHTTDRMRCEQRYMGIGTTHLQPLVLRADLAMRRSTIAP